MPKAANMRPMGAAVSLNPKNDTNTRASNTNNITNAKDNNSSDNHKELAYIANIVRAIVTSRKPPCRLREVLREYPEIEGEQLNYRKYGFSSSQELLKATNEFQFMSFGGETFINARHSAKSAHITSMVKEQKAAKSNSRHPRRNFDQSWNKSVFNRLFMRNAQQNQRRSSFLSGVGDRNNNQHNSNNRNSQLLQQKSKSLLQQHKEQKIQTQDNQHKQQLQPQQNKTTQQALQNRLSQQREQNKIPQQRPQDKTLQELSQNKIQSQSSQHKIPQQSTQNTIKHQSSQDKVPQQSAQKLIPQQSSQDKLSSQNKMAEPTISQKDKQLAQELLQPKKSDGVNIVKDWRDRMTDRMQQAAPQNGGHSKPTSTLNLGDRLNNSRNPQQQHQKSKPTLQSTEANQSAQSLTPRPILGQNNNSVVAIASALILEKREQQNQLIENQKYLQQLQLQQVRPILGANPTIPGNGIRLTSSVQNRLLRIRDNSKEEISRNGGNTSGSPLAETAFLEEELQFVNNCEENTPYLDEKSSGQQRTYGINHRVDPITALQQYCVAHGFEEPAFLCIYSKFSRCYHCRVNVNAKIFSTYPNEYTSELLAKISCAQKAIEELKSFESRRMLPTSSDSDEEIVEKLYTELLKHPSGSFARNIPEMFAEAYNEMLPDHWWTLLQKSGKFNTETTNHNAVIVLAIEDADNSKASSSTCVITQMDAIALPWTKKYWDVYITHCASTVDVWARLFGTKYNERFDNLINDIAIHMKVHKTRPQSVAPKNFYLVLLTECWHRVCVEEVDRQKARALCAFIDYGDRDWIDVSELYICDSKYLGVPAQAVLFSLFGLEDFAGNPNAHRHLEATLANKPLVAEILTKEADYYNTESSWCAKIQAVLYDTSSDEDVNLNPLLLDKICDDTPPPMIKSSGATNVLVSHVSDAGDLYLQILNTDFKYVQKLIKQLIESKFSRDQHKITPNDLNCSSLFLICDNANGQPQWYRGALTEMPRYTGDEEFEVLYVDHGITRRTQIAQMFNLPSLSTALSKFPRQAIKARLHNIPPITESIVGRMRALLPANCAAFVKMNEFDEIPYVTVYRRNEVSDMLCTINDDIRMEAELETSSLAIKDDDDSALVNVSISKNSSSSSLTSQSSKTILDLTRGATILSVQNSPRKDLPKLREYDSLPQNQSEFFEVRVTMSANPSNFIIQPYRDYPRLRDLMKELQEYCENNDEFIPADMVEVGQAYAAKNPDGFYHRVIVVNTYNGEMIHVCFCDFGDISILRSDQLKILPAKFRQLPKMAIQAKLYGIKAKHGDWTLDDCLHFRQMTVAQKFMASIMRVSFDKLSVPPTRILELELVDVTTEDDVYLHDTLLKENRAVRENHKTFQ